MDRLRAADRPMPAGSRATGSKPRSRLTPVGPGALMECRALAVASWIPRDVPELRAGLASGWAVVLVLLRRYATRLSSASLSSVGEFLLRFVRTVVLSRLLSPHDLGAAVALASILASCEMITDIGLEKFVMVTRADVQGAGGGGRLADVGRPRRRPGAADRAWCTVPRPGLRCRRGARARRLARPGSARWPVSATGASSRSSRTTDMVRKPLPISAAAWPV